MGTSVNQGSPSTPSWVVARSVLGHTQAPAERQSQEIWRAASADVDAKLTSQLGSAALAFAAAIAGSSTDPLGARNSFDAYVAKEGSASVVSELARRALVRAVAGKDGSLGFARELFAETVSYYVARDLPSVVGKTSRGSTPSEATALRIQIANVARAQAAAALTGRSATWAGNAGEWRRYVSEVVKALGESKK
jgi:hypothetical protein